MNKKEAKELYDLIKEIYCSIHVDKHGRTMSEKWDSSFTAGYTRCLSDIIDTTTPYWNIDRLKKWSKKRKNR